MDKKFSKKELSKLKKYWESAQTAETKYRERLEAIERVMSEDMGIDGMEFFIADNWLVGIGTIDRSYQLVQEEELEGDEL